jgi:hypothetical protein
MESRTCDVIRDARHQRTGTVELCVSNKGRAGDNQISSRSCQQGVCGGGLH